MTDLTKLLRELEQRPDRFTQTERKRILDAAIAALESRVLAERTGPTQQAMDAYLRVCRSGGMPSKLSEKIASHFGEALRLGYFTHPTPDDAKQVVTETMLTAAVGAFMKCEGTFTESIRAAIDAAMQSDKEAK